MTKTWDKSERTWVTGDGCVDWRFDGGGGSAVWGGWRGETGRAAGRREEEDGGAGWRESRGGRESSRKGIPEKDGEDSTEAHGGVVGAGFFEEGYGDGDDCVEALGGQLPVRLCCGYGREVMEGAGEVDGAPVWSAGICGACVG